MNDSKQSTARIVAKSIDQEGEKWMRVIATDPSLDADGERIDTASLHIPVKPKGWKYARDLTSTDEVDLPFLADHKWETEHQIGSVRNMFMNNDGELETLVGFTSLPRGKDAHTLAKEGHVGNSFSGTFAYRDAYEVDGMIYEAEIVELSMVFKGANRNARVLEVSKSVKRKDNMSKDEQALADKKAKIKALEAEVAEAEKPETESVAEAVVETPKPAVEPTPAPTVVETPSEEEDDGEKPTPETPEVPDTESKSIKQESKPMDKPITPKQVKDVPTPEVVEPLAKKATKKEQRELFVKQFVAYKTKNTTALQELNKKAMEMDGMSSKAIDYSDASALYQTEVVSTDILKEYNNIGRLGALVNKVDILGATQWKRIVEASGNGFLPVGIEESKQQDKPTWTPLTVLPKEHALIVAWYDAIARETPIAVYNQITRYIADEYAKLEDKIIISFAGATTGGGDTFAPTGLVPALVAADRIRNVATFSAANVAAGLGGAYGMLETDKPLTIVANRATWGQLAVVVDADGRAVFTNTGQQVTAGALGAFNVVISQEVPNGNAVLGAFADYDLVTRGGLETLFSREASVGNLNLFTDDASAVRACVDIAGKAARIESFVLIDFVPVVS